MLVTDITLDGSGAVVAPSPADRIMGREGDLVLVNGQHQPDPHRRARRDASAGGSSTPARPGYLSLRLDGQQLHPDRPGRHLPHRTDRPRQSRAGAGQPRRRPRPANGTGPFPADRRPLRPRHHDGRHGRQRLNQRRPARGHARHPGRLRTAAPPRRCPSRLPVQATPSPGPRHPHPPDRLPDGHGRDGRRSGMTLTIDGRTFDPDRDDQTVAYGTTEEWTVTNTSPIAHPFHLHVWPFTVLARSDGAPPPACRRTSCSSRPAAGCDYGSRSPTHRPQRLPLPHPRPRRPRNDGHRRGRLTNDLTTAPTSAGSPSLRPRIGRMLPW